MWEVTLAKQLESLYQLILALLSLKTNFFALAKVIRSFTSTRMQILTFKALDSERISTAIRRPLPYKPGTARIALAATPSDSLKVRAATFVDDEKATIISPP